MAHILVADDEPHMIELLSYALTADGHTLQTANDGDEALALLNRCAFDLAVLDILMPTLDGIQVCARIRQEPALAEMPILMLTAKATISDKIKGFRAGCDDYVVKPFSLAELRLRIQALLRRTQTNTPSQPVPTNGEFRVQDTLLVLDAATCQVRLDDRIISLTTTETKLLRYMLQHHDRILTSTELLQSVWNYPEGVGNTGLVRTHIKNLRAKIESCPESPSIIRTAPRRGYIVETATY